MCTRWSSPHPACVRTYKATHNIEYDAPLEARYWPHPAEIPLTREPTEIPHNVINIFTDGSKIGGKVGAAAVIIKDDKIIHQSKFRLQRDVPIIRQNG